MKTKKDYENWLNDLGDDLGEGLPERKAMGGRMPNKAKYGTWLRNNDPIAFNVGFNEYLGYNPTRIKPKTKRKK